MDTIKVKTNFKGFIAHRGLSGLRVENTLPSFILATKHSHCGVECDIHPSKDGILTVSHDSNLQRVFHKDIYIPSYNYSELKHLSNTSEINSTLDPLLYTPTLREYLDVVLASGKTPVIELKDTITLKDVKQFASIIKEYSCEDKIIVISFYLGLLVETRKYIPNVKAAFLTDFFNNAILDLCIQHNFSIDMNYKACTKEIIDSYHKAGLTVNVYTVNEAEDALRLISWGIDYITTNILEKDE